MATNDSVNFKLNPKLGIDCFFHRKIIVGVIVHVCHCSTPVITSTNTSMHLYNSCMDISARYTQLNTAQKRAVDTIDGPVMVVAGPGTGKTELISVRIANILQKTDTLPENILCLTFTDSGAAAMRERLISIIGKEAYKVAIHTFHSFGTEIINQHREYFYNGADFQPADDLTRYELLRTIFSELDYKNPLASSMNGEFTHQNDAARVIAELKRSGLTSDELRAVLDEDEAALDTADRIVLPLFEGAVNKTLKVKVAAALAPLKDSVDRAETIYEIPPLIRTIYDSLVSTLEECETVHPTKPLTAWKKQWLTKNSDGALVFKSRQHIVKLRTLAFVYYEYLRRMEAAGLYDYDDMILQVVHAMEVHDDLRFNLQEKFLYTMVDEFQDTNLAQMRILHNLTDTPVNEGRPNIMVVGDDDQAIYSFQGADISNILRFRELYPETALITLTDNYRSRADILSESRTVITQGSHRLETIIPELDKALASHKTGTAEIAIRQADTTAQERQWIVAEVQRLIKDGVPAQEIAILTRRHKELAALLPHLQKASIPVHYERQDDALEVAPVVTLELLARCITALAQNDHDLANSLLPQVLSHPAWGITPQQLWRLSSDAYDSRTRWMDRMETTPEFTHIHQWLIERAAASHQETLEVALDHLVGRPTEADTPEVFRSPLYEYYFSKEALDTNPDTYLEYLTALRTIRGHLREYAAKETLSLQSFVTFIELHRRLGAPLSMRRTVGEGDEKAIHLMTAHKSKGLEFEAVFIVNAIDTVWGEKARSPSRNINYPENLPLAPSGDTADERLRLFYVAMTRAKSYLNISYSSEDERGKQLLVASFLSEKPSQPIELPTSLENSVLNSELAWHTHLATPTKELEELLLPQLANYKLSATHLNNFLDVTRGGPRAFLLDNLLHFPSAKSSSASYGSAIHATLQQAHVHLVARKERKPLEDILHDFEQALQKERLSKDDYQLFLQKGSEQLRAFLDARYDDFNEQQKAELNFSHQDAHVGDAHLTGMIDVAEIDPKTKTMIVTDYKTGKPLKDGQARTDYEKIKLHKYTQQVMFYKLMVEHSRDYRGYKVTSGVLSFVEPTKTGEICQTRISYQADELDRFKKLLLAVWQRITSLDLPDTSEYDQSYKGILSFEQDLLDGTV